jgi:transcriptional regulator with XRE-family HTH domain
MSGQQLRRLRRQLGWTQAVLAVELGVAANTVARWERGERAIPEPVARLAKRLAGERLARRTRQ